MGGIRLQGVKCRDTAQGGVLGWISGLTTVYFLSVPENPFRGAHHERALFKYTHTQNNAMKRTVCALQFVAGAPRRLSRCSTGKSETEVSA